MWKLIIQIRTVTKGKCKMRRDEDDLFIFKITLGVKEGISKIEEKIQSLPDFALYSQL